MDFSSYTTELQKYKLKKEDLDYSKLEVHVPLLEQLDLVESSSVALFDMSTMNYRFLTKKFRFLLGLDHSAAVEQGMSYFTERMNDDDLAQFCDTSIQVFKFLTSKPPHERKLYKTCQDFRIQKEGICISFSGNSSPP